MAMQHIKTTPTSWPRLGIFCCFCILCLCCIAISSTWSEIPVPNPGREEFCFIPQSRILALINTHPIFRKERYMYPFKKCCNIQLFLFCGKWHIWGIKIYWLWVRGSVNLLSVQRFLFFVVQVLVVVRWCDRWYSCHQTIAYFPLPATNKQDSDITSQANKQTDSHSDLWDRRFFEQIWNYYSWPATGSKSPLVYGGSGKSCCCWVDFNY